MIDLTPLEVRQKKGDFRRVFRGYDAELVNDFLDLAADRMEELVKENMALSDAVEAMEEELQDFRDKEMALSDALMAAQKLREDARAHAEKESELMIREAKLQAEDARQEAARSLSREEETLRQVRARRAQLVESFRRLLERELSELSIIEESLELAGETESSSRGPDRTQRRGGPRAPTGSEPSGGESEENAPSGDGKQGSGPEAGEASGDEAGSEDEQEDWLSSLAEE